MRWPLVPDHGRVGFRLQGFTPLAIHFRPVGTKTHYPRLSRNAAKVNSQGRKPLETANDIYVAATRRKFNSGNHLPTSRGIDYDSTRRSPRWGSGPWSCRFPSPGAYAAWLLTSVPLGLRHITLALAATRRKSIARGVSPWKPPMTFT